MEEEQESLMDQLEIAHSITSNYEVAKKDYQSEKQKNAEQQQDLKNMIQENDRYLKIQSKKEIFKLKEENRQKQ